MSQRRWERPELEVRHEYLVRYSESAFKVHCVVCGGLLLVQRDNSTGRLLRYDCCTRCGQRYRYLDDAIDGEPLPEG